MRVSFEDWLQRPTPVSLIRPSLTRRRCQRSKYSHGLTPLSRTCLLETQTKSRRFSSVLSSLPRSKLAAEGSSAADGLGCKCHNNHKRCKSDRAKGLPPNSLVPELLYWQSKVTFIVKTAFMGWRAVCTLRLQGTVSYPWPIICLQTGMLYRTSISCLYKFLLMKSIAVIGENFWNKHLRS